MTLLQIRNQINEIDAELLNLILKRITYSELIAEIKYNENIPVIDESRENYILTNIKIKSADKYKYVLPIFRKIIDTSRNIQNEIIKNNIK